MFLVEIWLVIHTYLSVHMRWVLKFVNGYPFYYFRSVLPRKYHLMVPTPCSWWIEHVDRPCSVVVAESQARPIRTEQRTVFKEFLGESTFPPIRYRYTLTTGEGGLLAGIGTQSVSSLVLAGVDSTAIQARPAASPHLVSEFTSILKISRLFLYFFQKGDLYIQNNILCMGFATFCAFLKKWEKKSCRF